MSDFETNRKTVADAGENLRKAQAEIGNLIPLESDRSRVVALLNQVGDALVEVNEKFVDEDKRDENTESDVRPGFDRKEANRDAAHRTNANRATADRK
jgi:hypothetical protein